MATSPCIQEQLRVQESCARSGERRMRAGVMSKERNKRIWILGDVMMTEFETGGEGFELRALPERIFEFRTLVGRRGNENMKKLNSVQRLKLEYLTTLGRRKRAQENL